MRRRAREELLAFIQDSEAYIPFAVIGIFIVLAATFTSVYLLKMDSEVAETIYTTKKRDPRQTAVSLASSDLSRCLNYASSSEQHAGQKYKILIVLANQEANSTLASNWLNESKPMDNLPNDTTIPDYVEVQRASKYF